MARFPRPTNLYKAPPIVSPDKADEFVKGPMVTLYRGIKFRSAGRRFAGEAAEGRLTRVKGIKKGDSWTSDINTATTYALPWGRQRGSAGAVYAVTLPLKQLEDESKWEFYRTQSIDMVDGRPAPTFYYEAHAETDLPGVDKPRIVKTTQIGRDGQMYESEEISSRSGGGFSRSSGG